MILTERLGNLANLLSPVQELDMAQNDDWSWIFWLALAGAGVYYLSIKDDEEAVAAESFESSGSLVDRPTGETLASTTSTGTKWFVDNDSIKGPRSNRMAWVIKDHQADKTISHRETRELFEIDCDRGSYLTRTIIQYDADDNVTGGWDDDAISDKLYYAAPETLIYGVIEAACHDGFEQGEAKG